MFIFLSVCSLLVPLSMIILGYTWKDNSPKDRQAGEFGISNYYVKDEWWNMEICTQVLGMDKLCFRNHPGDTIDFYFDFNERWYKLWNDFCLFGVFTIRNYGAYNYSDRIFVA